MAHSIDLSHTIEDGMLTYPGMPGPKISDYLAREESRSHYTHGTEFYIGKIEMVANTGTYLDSPFHRYAQGADLAGLNLGSLADLEGVVARTPGRRIHAPALEEVFTGQDLENKAVLIHTGWAAHWRTEQYFIGHPFLTGDAAQFLVDWRAALVGIDTLNIDDTSDGTRPVHSLLLGAGIPIVEHMRGLELLPDCGFRFFAVPVKIQGLGSFPVRAFAIV